MANEPLVLWTAEARNNFADIIEYLRTEWSEKEIENFIDKLNKAIVLISKKPQLFRQTSSRNKLRKCVLSKHTSIFYKEQNFNI